MGKCLVSHTSEIDESYQVVLLLLELRTCRSSAFRFLILFSHFAKITEKTSSFR